ncbi:MAG: oligosaccharide flippase family protein [Anaerolineae bacterium]|nr:oligosaccharide flippase family protein [Anaerolineae bacterium]NIO00301.1 oligosaccharide flippase family protein [Anaerolineae bacterium]NIQ83079.1 oligosaccharide flippase family protein [Anaerolineae bacterium]
MQFRSFGKNAFFLFASQGFSAGTTLILVPLLARYLGIEDYGRYAYVYAFVGVFETLSVFGLHQIFVREVARKRDRASAYLGNVLRLKAPLTLAVFAVTLLASQVFVSRDLHLFVLICASEVLLRMFFRINLALGRAFERMEFEFLVTVLERITALVGILVVIRFDWGLTGVFLAFLCAAVVHSLLGTLLIWARLARPKFVRVQGLSRSLLVDAWPLGLSREAKVLHNRIGTVLLGQWSAPEVVGIYSGAHRIYQIVSLVLSEPMSQTAYPVLSRLHRDPRRFAHSFYRVVRLNALIGISLAASIWVLAPVIVRLLLGPEFEASVSILRWIAIAMPLTFLNGLLSVTLWSADRQHVDGFLTMGALLLNVILNWALIPSFGATGTAWALILAQLFTFFAKGLTLGVRGLPRPERKVHGEL